MLLSFSFLFFSFFFKYYRQNVTQHKIYEIMQFFIENFEFIWCPLTIIVGPKDLATLAHFISSPWPMPRRKKCPSTNKESPDCQDILPRTTLSSTNRDHGRGKRHVTRGSHLERPKVKHKHSGPAIGVWWRSNSKRGCHLRIKYPQLTSWPHLCGRDPWTVLSRSPQLTERQREWLMGRALKYGYG